MQIFVLFSKNMVSDRRIESANNVYTLSLSLDRNTDQVVPLF